MNFLCSGYSTCVTTFNCIVNQIVIDLFHIVIVFFWCFLSCWMKKWFTPRETFKRKYTKQEKKNFKMIFRSQRPHYSSRVEKRGAKKKEKAHTNSKCQLRVFFSYVNSLVHLSDSSTFKVPYHWHFYGMGPESAMFYTCYSLGRLVTLTKREKKSKLTHEWVERLKNHKKHFRMYI